MKLKKMICLLTALVICMSIMVMPASAVSSKSVKGGRGSTTSVTVDLVNKRNPGYLRIYNTSEASLNVKMYTSSNKYIWGEARAVQMQENREFYLGSNHSVYVIRVNPCLSSAYLRVKFMTAGNCNIR